MSIVIRSLSRAWFGTALIGSGAVVLVGCSVATPDGVDASPEAQLAARQDDLYVASDKIWGSTIPVCWENATNTNATERGWVEDAIRDSWEMVSRVDFTGWGSCASRSNGIRIRIRDEGPHTTGLGTELRGKSSGMILNFAFQNWSTGCQSSREYCIRTIAVHEFGHALGFAHEQNRPDTPSWCDQEQGSDGDVTFYPWDIDSVMNYCNPTWNGNGKLSNADIRGVQTYYGLRSSHALAGDFDGNGRQDVFVYAPGSNAAWVSLSTPTGSPNLSCNGTGFYGYDFWSFDDQALVLDYDGNHVDDLFLYRPGSAIAYLMRSNGNGSFSAVYASNNGIAGFDMWDVRDHALRLDFNGDDRDDLLTWRQGTGVVYLARSNGDGSFANVYASASGIGGAPMNGGNEQVLVFDYNGDGRDDLFIYRPGSGAAYALRSEGNGTFTPVYASSSGIAGYDLLSSADRVLVFDYNGDHKDDLLLYRPGERAVYVARSNGDGTFANAYAAWGIAGYDMASIYDRVTAFDYDGDDRDDLFLYRPGSNIAYVARSNGDGSFSNVFASHDGFVGFGLQNETDRAIALHANANKYQDLLLFREDTRAGRIVISSPSASFYNTGCMNACTADCTL